MMMDFVDCSVIPAPEWMLSFTPFTQLRTRHQRRRYRAREPSRQRRMAGVRSSCYSARIVRT